MTGKDFMKELRVLFFGWELLLYIAILFAIHFGLFMFIIENVLISTLIGIVGAVFFMFVMIIPNRRLKKHQFHLDELLKYVQNVSFFLRSGENVFHSLQATLNTVDRVIQKDIEKTIAILDKSSELDTEHFRKYDFPSLDQFHHNLLIRYERGGGADDLFGEIQKDMIYELKKRDELYKRRQGFAMNMYMLLGMSGGTLLVLRLIAPNLWDIFLTISFVSLPVIIITYTLVLFNLYFLQKKNLDISVRL